MIPPDHIKAILDKASDGLGLRAESLFESAMVLNDAGCGTSLTLAAESPKTGMRGFMIIATGNYSVEEIASIIDRFKAMSQDANAGIASETVGESIDELPKVEPDRIEGLEPEADSS